MDNTKGDKPGNKIHSGKGQCLVERDKAGASVVETRGGFSEAVTPERQGQPCQYLAPSVPVARGLVQRPRGRDTLQVKEGAAGGGPGFKQRRHMI